MMKITKKIENLRSSGFEKLKFQGALMGLRIVVFDAVKEQWHLYDFSLDIVKDKSLKDYLNSQKYVDRELIETETSYCTQEELNGLQVVECMTEADIRNAIAPIRKLQEYKGVA